MYGSSLGAWVSVRANTCRCAQHIAQGEKFACVGMRVLGLATEAGFEARKGGLGDSLQGRVAQSPCPWSTKTEHQASFGCEKLSLPQSRCIIQQP